MPNSPGHHRPASSAVFCPLSPRRILTALICVCPFAARAATGPPDHYLTPHFYQTGPFYALCGLAIVFAGWTLHRRRVASIQRFDEWQRESALAKDRERIARDIHDGVGSRLNRLILLSEAPDSAAAGWGPRPSVSKLAREISRTLDEIVWEMQPEKDTLPAMADYLSQYAVEYLGAAGLDLRLEFPGSLPPWPFSSEQRHHSFLLAAEALVNVVKHASATEVCIRLRADESSVTMEIEDNGTGFSTGNREATCRGNGLTNMRQRAEALGADLRVESAAGAGTRIGVTIPINPKSLRRAWTRFYQSAETSINRSV